VIFGTGLVLNWLGCHFLVPELGVPGLTLSSSVGVLAAGAGLVIYASRRIESLNTRPMVLLVARTTAAAVLTLVILTALHSTVSVRTSVIGQLATVVTTAVAAGAILIIALLLLGQRWQVPAPVKG